MTTVSTRMKHDLDHSKDKVRATELPLLLDRYSPAIKILSLDCFDTLLWRKTADPTDIFFDLQHKPMFKSLAFTASIRKHAETRARQLMLLKQQKSEVTLRDIYLESYPALNEHQLTCLAEEELAVEMEACFPYPFVIDLIRAAHQRGLQIIIVSDTYFKESELRRLLTATLPLDAMSAITAIYCSCEFGKSKANGLFSHVIQSLRHPPESFLHIGDNVSTDYAAPTSLKLHALHFLHEDEYVTHLLRLQAISAAIMDTGIRNTLSLASPFRGILSAAPPTDKPETLIGYASLGPIMYTFARFIHDEIAQLKSAGVQPKVLFLMRDAYLPSLACEAFAGEAFGKRVRISRFSAYAASFRTVDDIDHYLVDVIKSNRFRDITRQLLLPDKTAEPIIKVAERSPDPILEFTRLIHRSDILRIIFNKSADYRLRLMRHLEKTAEIKPGDTLMLIDLGYNGTVQRQLTPLFAENEMKVMGRYLIALRTPGWESNRRGLLDPSCCDDKALKTLVSYIALLEQLCTSNEKSVLDYDKDGNVIYSDVSMSDEQHAQLTLIQAECLRFIRDANHFYRSMPLPFSTEIFRKTILPELSRMVFFPTEVELKHLQTFHFDFNLGTKDVMKMFDPHEGLKGLHRRGIFFIEKNSKNMRMNYPAELRSASFELSLALLTQQRFALDIKLKDMLLRHEALPAILMRGHETHKTTLEALATYEGYYSVWTPVGTGDIQVSVLFGKNYEWVQIESAELIKMDAFIHQNEAQNTINAWPCLTFDQMIEKGGNLFECPSAASAMVMKANIKLDTDHYVFRFVYRPIARRVVETSHPLSSPKISFTLSY